MVDRERGYDAVESTEVGKRLGEVVVEQFYRLVGEALMGALEHRLGDVDRDGHARGPVGEHSGEQAPVAGTEVEDPARGERHLLEQGTLAFFPMGDRVRQREVVVDVLASLPLVGGHDHMLALIESIGARIGSSRGGRLRQPVESRRIPRSASPEEQAQPPPRRASRLVTRLSRQRPPI